MVACHGRLGQHLAFNVADILIDVTVPHCSEDIFEMVRTDLIEKSDRIAEDNEVISNLLADVDVSIVSGELGKSLHCEREFPGNVGGDFVLKYSPHYFTFGHGNSWARTASEQ